MTSESSSRAWPVENCGQCGTPLDLREVAPLTVVECPGCRSTMEVLRNFGPFELESFLAQGGVGAVYRALDRVLQRAVAVKVLQPAWSANEEVVSQFKREAVMAASIRHPNVVRVYTAGEVLGMFYIAMELAEHGALDARMEAQGCLTEAEVLGIFHQVAEGLAAAQRAGLIHRDIKPGNILFARDGCVKIVDFGLALKGQPQPRTDSEGDLWGTPFYIAPEILSGAGADFRSDMYALGSSMWHALVGEPPHPAQNTSIPDLLETKKRPVDVRKVIRGIHPRTAKLMNRTVAFEASERYQSYEELLEDIRAAMERKELPKERRPLFAWAGVLGVLIALCWGTLEWKAAGGRDSQVSAGLPRKESLVERSASAGEKASPIENTARARMERIREKGIEKSNGSLRDSADVSQGQK